MWCDPRPAWPRRAILAAACAALAACSSPLEPSPISLSDLPGVARSTLQGASQLPATPVASGPLPGDLAPTFGEPFHGFVFTAPLVMAEGDQVEHGSLDLAGRFVRLDATRGAYRSRIVQRAGPFTELLPSWNVAAPPGTSFRVDVRVGRSSDGYWSPWLLIGDWGEPVEPRLTRFDGGRVMVDVFESDDAWDRAQLRVAGTGGEGWIDVHRTSLAFTDARALPGRVAATAMEPWPAPVSLRVPVRSQRDEDPSIAHRVCSPTSVSMVMEHNGVDVPTADLAALILDPSHDIYGNWSRAIQAAYTRGVPGSLVRVSSWDAVATFLERGIPLVASIRAEVGELRGAPYRKTDGHLLVITGLGPAGRVLVNDPAAHWPADVRRAYDREDLERCWFANGGVAYALDPAPAPSRATAAASPIAPEE